MADHTGYWLGMSAWLNSLLAPLWGLFRRKSRKQDAMSAEPHFNVLFVCMGNICRSPTAEGVFRKVVTEMAPQLIVQVDSAGTHAYHTGEPPDPRAQRAALRRGIDISEQRARKVRAEDFHVFDYVLAMDEVNFEVLVQQSPEELADRVRLFLDFAPALGRRDVPDPYYGGAVGFEYVLDLVEEAARGLASELLTNERSTSGGKDRGPVS